MIEDILTSTDGPILAIRFNRPAKKNAITSAMYEMLADAFERASADPQIRVIILCGTDGIFTSGNDLKDFLNVRPNAEELPVYKFLHAIAACPKIIIAGVCGAAIGIGTTMLLHADLVFATPEAQFATPFVDLALVPEAASSMLLPRLIGHQRAARHLILGDTFDAATALQYGLVTRIVAASELDAEMGKAALAIAAKPPEAVQLTKQLMKAPDEEVIDRIVRESKLFGERLGSAEAREAFAAFLEKRPPNFTRP